MFLNLHNLQEFQIVISKSFGWNLKVPDLGKIIVLDLWSNAKLLSLSVMLLKKFLLLAISSYCYDAN